MAYEVDRSGDRFRDCLHWAEDRLHWGTDPRALDQAAQALERFESGHVLVEQLAQRAAFLRAARRELVRRTTMRPPLHPPQPAGFSGGRA